MRYVFVFVGVVLISSVGSAQAALPVLGVAVEDYIALFITGVATVIGSVLGGYFAFAIVQKGMDWGRAVLEDRRSSRADAEWDRN